jgi:hypothetical protein
MIAHSGLCTIQHLVVLGLLAFEASTSCVDPGAICLSPPLKCWQSESPRAPVAHQVFRIVQRVFTDEQHSPSGGDIQAGPLNSTPDVFDLIDTSNSSIVNLWVEPFELDPSLF